MCYDLFGDQFCYQRKNKKDCKSLDLIVNTVNMISTASLSQKKTILSFFLYNSWIFIMHLFLWYKDRRSKICKMSTTLQFKIRPKENKIDKKVLNWLWTLSIWLAQPVLVRRLYFSFIIFFFIICSFLHF